MKKNLMISLLVGCSLVACSEEIGQLKDVNPETVYQQYTLEVGPQVVEASACFRFAGPNGTTLFLNEPASVQLWGKKMQMDSSNGVVYSATIPRTMAAAELTFQHINQKKYTQTIPITAPELPSALLMYRVDSVRFMLQLPEPIQSAVLQFSGATDGDKQLYWERTNGGIIQLFSAQQALLAVGNGQMPVTIETVSVLPLQESTQEGGQVRVVHQHVKLLKMNTLAQQ